VATARVVFMRHWDDQSQRGMSILPSPDRPSAPTSDIGGRDIKNQARFVASLFEVTA
jgi:hypothetical protein